MVSPTTAATPGLALTGGRGKAHALFWLALVVAVAAGLNGITLPWQEDPERGLNATAYSVHWVWHHLHWGLGVTLGAPVFYVGAGDPPHVLFNWHHPPLYSLWLWLFAVGLGDEPWVLRAAHLLLFLPSVPAMYFLVARVVDRRTAGVAALLYATCPYTTYFGFMVLQDGLNLSFAVVTCWLFQRHLEQPERHRLWLPGLAFFLCGAMDIPGYFTGFSLFGLALLRRPLWPAMRSVAAMFLVSVAAFAVTALHYGLVLGGGPASYLREMLDVAEFEVRSAEQLSAAPYLKQARAVFVQFGAAPLVALALLGAALGITSRVPAVRRLAGVGAWVALPGIASYLVFFSHAPWHMYWPLPAFGGVAILAAVVAVQGIACWQGGRRPLGGALLGLCVGAMGFGLVRSHTLIGEMPPGLDGSHRVIGRVIDRLQGCTFVLTTANTGFGQFYGHEFVTGNIATAELLEQLFEIGRNSGVLSDVGFILEGKYAGSALHRRLEELARPTMVDGLWLYRFRVPPRRPGPTGPR